MTTTTLKLDSNYNSIITEEKIRLNNPEDSIYKNANRFKHNDIVYIPKLELITSELKNIAALPNRYTNITGTKTFKELQDFFLTFNLLNQYLSPHSEDRRYIALDRRYIMKALGNRFHNKNNNIFNNYFKLEITGIKGIKGKYASGYSITEKGDALIGSYSKVVHKDSLEKIIKKVIEGTYKEEKILNINNIGLNKIPELINNSFIVIPEENIQLLKTLDSSYKNSINLILKNYHNGKLYYNKDVKPYGRTYSYIHTIKREVRRILFNGFTELDLESAAQSILYRKVIGKVDSELKTMKEYIDNKQAIREKLSQELDLPIFDIKKIIQIITFLKRLPSEKQLNFFDSLKKFPAAVHSKFLIELSKDFNIIDKYLSDNLNEYEYNLIKACKGKVSKIDVRVFTFQSIESKIMERIQSMLSNNSFHLHDAVYVKDITTLELEKTYKKYVSKNSLNISNNILVYKKYEVAFTQSQTKIKSINKLREYISFCISNNKGSKIKSKTSHHHILPNSMFSNYSNLKTNKWNSVHLTYNNHYYAHWLLTEAIDDYGQLHAFTTMHNKDLKDYKRITKELQKKSLFQMKNSKLKWKKEALTQRLQ